MDSFLREPHRVRDIVAGHINSIFEGTSEVFRKSIIERTSQFSSFASQIRSEISSEVLRAVENAKFSVETDLQRKYLQGVENLSAGNEMLKHLGESSPQTLEANLRSELLSIQQQLKVHIQQKCGEIFSSAYGQEWQPYVQKALHEHSKTFSGLLEPLQSLVTSIQDRLTQVERGLVSKVAVRDFEKFKSDVQDMFTDLPALGTQSLSGWGEAFRSPRFCSSLHEEF